MLTKRGEANLLWYIFYLGAAVLLLGLITFMGVNTFSVHVRTAELHNELILEQTLNLLYTTNPYTGEYDTIRPDIPSRLEAITLDEWAVRIDHGNTTVYSNQEIYERMIERIGTQNELRRTTLQSGQEPVSITMVMRK